ncbi:MAG: cyanophycin synthetase [Ezakiella sp.]|nr:cyanophycin synthetase [Bacillota bacterium]MDY3946400.1 cyanophycin synthetase [Ezakiella sp.]
MNYRDAYKKILNANIDRSEREYDELIQKLEARAGNVPDRTLLRFKRAQELLHVGTFPVINVVGTNGKGTIAKAIYDASTAFGIDTALYISPHLINYNERIRSSKDNKSNFISNYHLFELIKLIDELECEIAPKYGSFTYFEVISLAASIYFQNLYNEGDIKFVILEAGVGGRFDTTKEIGYSLMSVIASISVDHKSYLGDNIADIAWHKAGIIAANSVVLTLNQNEAYDEIKKETLKEGAKLFGPSDLRISSEKEDGSFILKFNNNFIKLNPIQKGPFRRENYSLAAAAMTIILEMTGIKIDVNKLEEALNKSYWEGRMELLKKDPITILDGAHNEDAVTKLYDSFKDRSIISVVAYMNTKEHAKMAGFINRRSKNVIVTTNGDHKSVELDELKRETGASKAFSSPIDAINYAREIALKDDIILISGSLYLVGIVLANRDKIK